ncbi:MAG: AraC family transcriptional regulator [bacterium]|nr:AraC family transcriptional regulator [bacterium]
MIENEAINKAINYIIDHMGEEICVEDVADHCHFSKFYFNRMFKEATGESVYAFIKRAKMEQSAFRLKVERQKSVTDISGDYGYSSSNFSSAFRQQYHMSPADFRKSILEHALSANPNWEEYSDRVPEYMPSFEECDENVTIEVLDDLFVIYERYKGNYRDLKQVWCDFLGKYQDYMTEESLLLEITYDDPSITDADNCLFDVCLSVDLGCTLENTRTVEGGRYIVYHFKGHLWEIYPAHQALLGIWFAKSGYEIDKRCGFDIYRFVDPENMYMVIDFYVPIK